jgi:hypothetical protein
MAEQRGGACYAIRERATTGQIHPSHQGLTVTAVLPHLCPGPDVESNLRRCHFGVCPILNSWMNVENTNVENCNNEGPSALGVKNLLRYKVIVP